MRPAHRRLLPLTGLNHHQFTAVALRTNLTMRQIAAVFNISTSQTHRIIDRHTRLLTTLLPLTVNLDRRWSWTLDGTLVPTRDHTAAARSRNYRWSTNAQVLSRRADLAVVAITGGGPGNRNDTVHYHASSLPQLVTTHGRVLAAVAYLHNTKTAVRDISQASTSSPITATMSRSSWSWCCSM